MHKIHAVAGYESVRYGIGRAMSGQRSGYFTDDVNYRTLSNGAILINAGSAASTPTNLASAFFKADYGLSDKYMLSVAVRRDGCSRFGKSDRYGVFPSFSAAWRISSEPFFNRLSWISDLKLRGSWGKTGNQLAVSPQNAFFRFGGDPTVSYYDMNGTFNSSVRGFYPLRVPNPDARWETRTTTDIGIETRLWNNKINLIIDWYSGKATDLLFNPVLPGAAGDAQPAYVNIASMSNSGIDLELSYNKTRGDFKFSSSVVFTSYRNEITKIADGETFFYSGSSRIGSWVRNETGHPVSSFYGYNVIGLFQTNDEVQKAPSQDGAAEGFFRFENIDTTSFFGYQSINSNDRTFIGNPNPKYTTETATFEYLNIKWREVYSAVLRCNSVIQVTNLAFKNGTIDQLKADMFLEQARALRGWYHFEAWRMWEKIPYIDENTDIDTVTNKGDIRSKIIADILEGTMLPDNMGQIGKFNGTVSKVLLAKALMQMNHDYSIALTLLNDAINGTKPNGADIGLAPTYSEIFDIVNRNAIEAVYTVQYSVNDGSLGWNGGWGEILNFPYKSGGSPGGCCGFFQPTQEFVNSFRTSGGLPLLDFSYNDDPVKSDQGIPVTAPFVPDAGPLDPRLDWSVGRRGIPYWDWGKHTGADWIRDQTYAGPYSPKKQVYKKSDEGKYTEAGNWTSGWTANGYRMIRFADLLLLLAECQIETGDLNGALTNINAVRNRASNPDGFVKEADCITPSANYDVKPYPSFRDQDYARKALYMERKLELGQEGHRYFDLNRWGITVTELNRALTYEKTMPWGGAMYGHATVGPEDITYPVPQYQIDLSKGKLVQNR